MKSPLRIGTRESELAVWQAMLVKDKLTELGYQSTLVYIKSEGDIDLQTPLYEMGVQGIFTKTLDRALLNDRIDIAVHSMKDVPITLPVGIQQAAVLERGNYKDLLVFNESLMLEAGAQNSKHHEAFVQSLQNGSALPIDSSGYTIATSSIRRKAQWLHRYPQHTIENLRGNVNTRLAKLKEHQWHGAIFAAAGLERIQKKPTHAVELDWMLPAPAQGAIMVVCRVNDTHALQACLPLNHPTTEICTRIERAFLRELLGGCSTPISALAQIDEKELYFRGNMLTTDGKEIVSIEKRLALTDIEDCGISFARELLQQGGKEIAAQIQHGKED